jgi:5-(carboxyamino)imidazole ribonucleotide synthase
MILPGSTIGILGGGQLARMLALAAKPMGYNVVVLDPDPDCPASSVVDEVIIGAFNDLNAFAQLAQVCDVVTLEFENVPSECLKTLEKSVPLRPSRKILEYSRDRLLEKAFITKAGVRCAPFQAINTIKDFESARFPAILKTAQLGYDGKGQAKVYAQTDAIKAFERFGSVPCVLEGIVDFFLEISVIVARSKNQIQCFPVFENQHQNGILDITIAPARIPEETQEKAKEIAVRLAEHLELHGLLCVEMFVTNNGQLIVNEIAPRPHNSGHVTLETCQTSQFEQAIRAICNLPLGNTELLSSGAMANLLGEQWQDHTPNWQAALEKGVALHLYQKREARAGRKMGHLTALGEDAFETVKAARDALQ